jgi:hypothetical protein
MKVRGFSGSKVAGLFLRPAALCKWSSLREYAGVGGESQERFCGLRIDRGPLPFDVHASI